MATPATTFRRPNRPKAARDIVVDGGLVRKGESIPRSVPARDVDRLRSHGFASAHRGDDGVSTG